MRERVEMEEGRKEEGELHVLGEGGEEKEDGRGVGWKEEMVKEEGREEGVEVVG